MYTIFILAAKVSFDHRSFQHLTYPNIIPIDASLLLNILLLRHILPNKNKTKAKSTFSNLNKSKFGGSIFISETLSVFHKIDSLKINH